MLHLALGGRWMLSSLGFDAFAFVPISAGSVTSQDGSIALRAAVAGVGLLDDLSPPSAALGVGIDAGFSGTVLLFEGNATAPYRATSGTAWGALPYGGVMARYRLTNRTRLRFDGRAGLLMPEPILRVASHDIGTFGRPLVLLSLGLEVSP